MAQVSLAWMLTKPEVTAPIIGTTSMSNLEDILGASGKVLNEHFGLRCLPLSGCLDVTLTEEEVKYLEEPYKPNKIIGHF